MRVNWKKRWQRIWASRWLDGLVLALIAGVALVYIFYKGYDANWDWLNYHLYNPAAVISGWWEKDFLVAGIQTSFNPTLHLIPYLLVKNNQIILLNLLGWLISCGNLILLFLITKKIIRPFQFKYERVLIWLVSAAGFLAANHLGGIGSTMGDSWLAMMLLTGCYGWLKVNEDEQRRTKIWPWLMIGGVFGVAVGLKMTVAISAVAWAVAWLIGQLLVVKKINWRATVSVAGGMLLGWLLVNGWWLVKVGQEFGNPFFPFFNQFFQSPWGRSVAWTDQRFVPQSLGSGLLYPFKWLVNYELVSETRFFDLKIPVTYVLLIGSGIIIGVIWFKYYKSIKKSIRALPGPFRGPQRAIRDPKRAQNSYNVKEPSQVGIVVENPQAEKAHIPSIKNGDRADLCSRENLAGEVIIPAVDAQSESPIDGADSASVKPKLIQWWQKMRPEWKMAVVVLIGWWLINYGCWLWLFGIYRYLVILELLSPLVIVLVMGGLSKIWPKGKYWSEIAVGLLIVLLVVVRPAWWGRISWANYDRAGRIDINWPAIEADERTVILLKNGYSSVGHLVALMATEARVVNLSALDTPFLVTDHNLAKIAEIIAAGERFYLIRETVLNEAEIGRSLEQFGLRLTNNCDPVTGDFYREYGLTKYEFCEVVKLKVD